MIGEFREVSLVLLLIVGTVMQFLRLLSKCGKSLLDFFSYTGSKTLGHFKCFVLGCMVVCGVSVCTWAPPH